MNRTDIIQLLGDLRRDLAENPDAWENPTLDLFLEAMQAWLEATASANDDPGSWDLIADMLHAGKIYE